jgi:alpha-glucosidase (family GH31 glycosyl hydrolase)
MKPFTPRPKANKDAIVSGKNYRFTILTDALFRYEWAEDGQFEDRASTFAVNRDLPVPEFRVLDNGEDSLEIITSRFHLSYDKKRFSPSGLLVDVKGKLTLWGSQWRYGDFGGTLGGTARTLDGADGRIPMGSGVVSRKGYACIDDSGTMMFDGNGWVGARKSGDRGDGYLFCYGHDYKDAIKAYYKISGSQPLLPRWALGNWWSRYHPYSADEYLTLMDKFREERIPLSVGVLDMDWHWVHDKRVTHAGWTGYSFDRNLFPDPAAFGREMHKRDLKITLNDHPHNGVHAFEDSYEEMAMAVNHDTSHHNPILFDPTNPKFFKAFFDVLHRNVEKDACDFWW